jgi:hypothetical protein
MEIKELVDIILAQDQAYHATPHIWQGPILEAKSEYMYVGRFFPAPGGGCIYQRTPEERVFFYPDAQGGNPGSQVVKFIGCHALQEFETVSFVGYRLFVPGLNPPIYVPKPE